MKRVIFSLALVLMSTCFALVSCTSSTEEDNTLVFSFPGQITHSMGSDASKSITIEPNAQWELSLSKSAASHFYIADGDQKRQNMRGEAGKFQIEIKTTSTLDFDDDIECEVTLTMKDGTVTESRVIATLTKTKAQRVVTVYSAKVADGAFVEQTDGETVSTVYSTSAVGSDGIAMLVSKDDIDNLEARIKVESNCAWTMVLPEWMEANALSGDASSAKEIVLKVNAELLPENVYTGNIEFIATENEQSIKTIAVSIDAQSIAKNVEIYAAEIADGEYVVESEDENGPIYKFSESQISDAIQVRVNAQNITEADALLKVVTNFKWNIEAPEWIKPIEDQQVGQSVVLLEVDYSKLPLSGDVAGEVKIIDVAKSKAISTINLTISESSLTPIVKIYPAVIENDLFIYPEGESDFSIEYSAEEVSADGIKMIWPEDNAWSSARVKVECNLPISLSMPEWVVVGAELEVGVNELQLRADNTQLPKEATSIDVKFLDASKSEERVLSTVKVSYPGIDSFFLVSGFEKEAIFDVEGMTTREGSPVDHVRGTIRTTKNGVKVWAVGMTVEGGKSVVKQSDWVTTTLSDWDGDDMVQYRNLDVSVSVNEGAARESYIFVVPSSIKIDNAKAFFEFRSGIPTGKLVAKYSDYLATIIKQDEATIVSTDLFSVINMNESASLSSIKAHWLAFQMPSGVKLSEIYNLTYTKKSDNDNSIFACSKGIESVAFYCADAEGEWVATDAALSWLKTQQTGDGFKIIMDTAVEGASYSKQNENYVGGILIKFTDGTYALVICYYDMPSDAEAEDLPLVSFAFPDYAPNDESVLAELKSGALYDKYKSYNAPIFHLTYTKRTSIYSMLSGINYEWTFEYLDGCEEWLSYEPGEEFQTIYMNATGKAEYKDDDPIVNNNVTGVIIFRSGTTVKLVLICTLAIPE